jgi:hypothetical protein
MAVYSALTDIKDPAIAVTEAHLVGADALVDGTLRNKQIDPDDLTLPIPLLTKLAVAMASREAAIEGAIGENSPLIAKAREYERTIAALEKLISREALGLSYPTGSGFGFVTLGRG